MVNIAAAVRCTSSGGLSSGGSASIRISIAAHTKPSTAAAPITTRLLPKTIPKIDASQRIPQAT